MRFAGLYRCEELSSFVVVGDKPCSRVVGWVVRLQCGDIGRGRATGTGAAPNLSKDGCSEKGREREERCKVQHG